jgi:hypothetical protein
MDLRRVALPSFIWIATTLVPASAVAQTAGAAAHDQAASDRADDLVKRAVALVKKDRHGEAEPLLREAWGLKRSYDIAGNLGLVEAELGRWREAAEHLRFAMNSFPTSGKPEHRKLLDKTFARVSGQVAPLTIRVNIDGAEVLVDGASVGTSPLRDSVFVEPGSRAVEARRPGYLPVRLVVSATGGAPESVDLALRTQPPAPAMDAKGPSPSARRAILITGGVTAGAALVAGSVFSILAWSAADTAEAKDREIRSGTWERGCSTTSDPEGAPPGCADLRAAIKDEATFTRVAIGSFIGAGVVGAGTLIYALVTPKRRDTNGLRVTPVVGAGQGGLFIQGTF